MAALVAFALKAGTMGPVDKATDKLDAVRKKKLTDMMAEATASANSKPAAAAAGSAARPASIAVPSDAAARDEPSSPQPGQAITARVSIHILLNPSHNACQSWTGNAPMKHAWTYVALVASRCEGPFARLPQYHSDKFATEPLPADLAPAFILANSVLLSQLACTQICGQCIWAFTR